MGLDVVEVVMECEKTFEIELADWRLEKIRTVGDLFELVCEQLNLSGGVKAPKPVSHEELVSPRVRPPSIGWTRDTVWVRLVRLVTDQLQVAPQDVRYSATFADDLGAD